jgi:predicted transcriptional regulator of viral defense system
VHVGDVEDGAVLGVWCGLKIAVFARDIPYNQSSSPLLYSLRMTSMCSIIAHTGHMIDLRQQAKREEIDYLELKYLLRDLSQYRTKISALLRSGYLVRVKKGLYVFGPKVARAPICQERLANLIYGPSYVSLDYALSFYGLIPERVHVVQSVTLKRGKSFTTPLGVFEYQHLSSAIYPVGVTQNSVDGSSTFLIATPEKALTDKIVLSTSGTNITSPATLEAYLFQDLRMERDALRQFNKKRIREIAKVFPRQKLLFLRKILGA